VRYDTLTHKFVEEIPKDLEEGRLYVSIRYRTAVHLCPCGCLNRVVTPIKPPKWHLTFDGESVSLSPSVGNWQLPCRSHYVIENGRVRWAKHWTPDQITAGRARDQRDVHDHYASRAEPERQPHPLKEFVARVWRHLRPHAQSR
jgi:hypothetical protein